MELRILHGERVESIRRAIAVSQLVPQSDETLVGYWLACYTRDAVTGRTAPAAAPQRKGRRKPGPSAPMIAAG
jgi:hypothetical protein